MQMVLVIAGSSQQQEYLRSALNLGEDVQVAAANLRQINPKNLRTLRQFDLIVMEDISHDKGRTTMECLLAALKHTGLPIILLPTTRETLGAPQEPLVLNLTDQSIAQPGLAALINKVRVQYYVSIENRSVDTFAAEALVSDIPRPVPKPLDAKEAMLDFSASLLQTSEHQMQATRDSKVASALATIGRLSNQLKEPLSNMNLAIHMLSRVRSLEERDHYIQVLREEYQRELKLVNELEAIQSNLESMI